MVPSLTASLEPCTTSKGPFGAFFFRTCGLGMTQGTVNQVLIIIRGTLDVFEIVVCRLER